MKRFQFPTSGPSPLSSAPIRATSQIEESPVYQPNELDGHELHDDVDDFLDVLIARPASPFVSLSLDQPAAIPT
jgi:hypothetical protein